ncbi:hypothetical protein BDEG_27155 [Batrachochytrium dendrobatidis JEL423]|uniref:Uncharacterized protein n=1 Tax=Batrachochytrium dendrobatidis (strain JEL423) TaxID=403673 RepID=A0A177WWK3_BATDL|nr:hypothetical protein BDEG_27155 [Batrachochytrium dendrobatidis JEL423]
MNTRGINHDASIEESRETISTESPGPSRPASALWRKTKDKLKVTSHKSHFHSAAKAKHYVSGSTDERRELLSESEDDQDEHQDQNHPHHRHIEIESEPEEYSYKINHPGMGKLAKSDAKSPDEMLIDIEEVAQLTNSNIGKILSRGDRLDDMQGKAGMSL